MQSKASPNVAPSEDKALSLQMSSPSDELGPKQQEYIMDK